MTDSMYLLQIEGLTKRFKGLTAVDDLSFRVKKGEIAGLIGPNGAGKTTVFNIITGGLKCETGRVIFNGHNIAGKSPHVVVRRGIGRTFQSTLAYTNETVLENAVRACLFHRTLRTLSAIFQVRRSKKLMEDCERKALELLEFVGLESYRHEKVKELAFGHQRMLSITIALASDPIMLFLDEPVGGMNEEERLETKKLLITLKNGGLTILLIEHDVRFVMSLCDSVTAVSHGKKIASGAPSEVQSNADVIEAYLGGSNVAVGNDQLKRQL